MFKNRYSLLSKRFAISALLLPSVLPSTFAQALTLTDVLNAAMANQSIANTEFKANNNTSWLASNPKLALSYLKSDLKDGTDETEISLNLPIKSSQQKLIDEKLVAAQKLTQSLLAYNQKLTLSGQIRQQVWAIKISQNKQENLTKKLDFLDKLEQQYQTLFNNAAATKYPLLLIKKEKIDTQIAQLEQTQRLTTLMEQYQALTGLMLLPKDIVEKNIIADLTINQLINEHPLVKKLEQQWFEQQQRLTLADNQSEPWNLSLSAKSLNNASVDEKQIGIAAELPLNFFNITNQAVSNEWAQAQGEYQLARSLLLITLKNQLQSVINEQHFLTQKQQLLQKAKSLSKDIIRETQLLVEAEQIEQGQAIRRMLNAFNTKAQFSLNQLLLLKNNAMLRQAAGLSL